LDRSLASIRPHQTRFARRRFPRAMLGSFIGRNRCALFCAHPQLQIIVTVAKWQELKSLVPAQKINNPLYRLHGYTSILARVLACWTVTACRFVTVRRTHFLIVHRQNVHPATITLWTKLCNRGRQCYPACSPAGVRHRATGRAHI